MSGGEVGIYYNSTWTILTEGTDWNASTNNDTTATSLAAAIDAISDISATANGATVTITRGTSSLQLYVIDTIPSTGMLINGGDIFRSHCYSSTDAQFVICGLYGRVFTIADSALAELPTINGPSDCTERTSGTGENLLCNGYDGSYYICTGDNSTIIRSSDGVSWSAASAVATRNAADGIYSILDSKYAPFVLAGAGDSVTSDYYFLKSVDNGDNWVDVGLTTNLIAYEIAFINDLDGDHLYTVVDYADESVSGSTITVRIDGTNNVLTECYFTR